MFSSPIHGNFGPINQMLMINLLGSAFQPPMMGYGGGAGGCGCQGGHGGQNGTDQVLQQLISMLQSLLQSLQHQQQGNGGQCGSCQQGPQHHGNMGGGYNMGGGGYMGPSYNGGYNYPALPTPYCGGPVVVDHGRVWGDPHFVGADGGKYDVQGEAGKTYNILSDYGLQFNAKFDAWGGKSGATIMSEAAVTLRGNQIQFSKDGTLHINGEKLGDGKHMSGMVEKSGNNLKLNTGEYSIDLQAKGGYLNYDFKSDNAFADRVMPHGLWGQSVDGDGKARNGDKGAGAQGGGAIEGLNGVTEKGDKSAVKLYETNGLWDTNFLHFNRYW